MLPDLRILFGSMLAALLVLTASLGVFASLRVAQDKIDPLARTSLIASRSIVLLPRDSAADGNRPEQIAEIAGNSPETTAAIRQKTENDAAAATLTEPEPAATPAQDAKAIDPDRTSDPRDPAANVTSQSENPDPAELAPAVAASEAAPAEAAMAPVDQPDTTASIPANLTKLPRARPRIESRRPIATQRARAQTARRRISRNRAPAVAASLWPAQQPQWPQPNEWQRQTRNNRANTATDPFSGLFGNGQSKAR